MSSINDELLDFKQAGLLRSLSCAEGLDFASNDYLGLSRSEKIKSQLIEFLKNQETLGSTGSRLVSGNNKFIEETESFIAGLFGTEAALIFGSGYLAGLGVVTALASNSGPNNTEFFSDERNHASLIDGIRLASSPYQIFRHNDLEMLEAGLKKSSAQRKVIVTESIFSMDGDFAPVDLLEKLAEKYDAYLVLDEAHATGTAGPMGLGLTPDKKNNKIISIHTCGKALGAYGAFVCLSASLKELLINKARTFIFATALPPYLIAHIRYALVEMTQNKIHYEKLLSCVEYSKKLFHENGFEHSGSHIVPFIVGENNLSQVYAKELQKKGMFTKAIRFPSVPDGSARLRITLKSFHKKSDIEFLCVTLKELNNEYLCNRN